MHRPSYAYLTGRKSMSFSAHSLLAYPRGGVRAYNALGYRALDSDAPSARF